MASFPERLLRAALLHADTYEEVEADTNAGRQALGVVLLSSAAVGIGGIANSGAEGILVQIVCAVVGWWTWAYTTYFIGTRLLPTPETSADPGAAAAHDGLAGAPASCVC
jgi:hypothetical protein